MDKLCSVDMSYVPLLSVMFRLVALRFVMLCLVGFSYILFLQGDSMNKERKKYIMMILEANGLLNYGKIIPKEICEQVLQETCGSDEYIFGLMSLRDLLNGRGWLCKIRNQEHIEILASSNINLEQNRWAQNHQKKYKKRDEALSNIHYEQVNREDVDKIMLERAKLNAVLRGIKSILNKYL